MPVPVVSIRYVRVVMNERDVPMPVTVCRTNNQDFSPMFVLVVLVVLMKMIVLNRLVLVEVVMSFTDEQRNAKTHRAHGGKIVPVQPIDQNGNRNQNAHHRRGREVGGFPRSTDHPQGVGIEHDADSVAQTSQQQGTAKVNRRGQMPTGNSETKCNVDHARRHCFYAHDCKWVMQRQSLR